MERSRSGRSSEISTSLEDGAGVGLGAHGGAGHLGAQRAVTTVLGDDGAEVGDQQGVLDRPPRTPRRGRRRRAGRARRGPGCSAIWPAARAAVPAGLRSARCSSAPRWSGVGLRLSGRGRRLFFSCVDLWRPRAASRRRWSRFGASRGMVASSPTAGSPVVSMRSTGSAGAGCANVMPEEAVYPPEQSMGVAVSGSRQGDPSAAVPHQPDDQRGHNQNGYDRDCDPHEQSVTTPLSQGAIGG